MAARWTVAVALGVRPGETLGLLWRDIDLEERLLRVTATLQRQRDGSLALVAPKTARSRRTLPLPDLVTESLRTHRQQERRRIAA